MTVEPTDVDRLKFALAIGKGGVSYLSGAVSTFERIDPGPRAALLAALESIDVSLGGLLRDDEDPEWYSSGRPVWTIVEFPDCVCVSTQIWHPDVGHELNRPRDLAELGCPSGGRHRLIITEPGVIETVTEGSPGAR